MGNIFIKNNIKKEFKNFKKIVSGCYGSIYSAERIIDNKKYIFIYSELLLKKFLIVKLIGILY